MAKHKARPHPQKGAFLYVAAALIAAVAATIALKRPPRAVDAAVPAPVRSTGLDTNVSMTSTIEINQAVMVTVDLNFGDGPLPTIAEALTQIERRYESAEGAGRTFAILDAYGGPTKENKLRMSMHVSAEKVGGGNLVFRRTGKTLWYGRFIPAPPEKKPPALGGKNLMILVDNGAGKTLTVDGSSNPLSILEATVKELGQPLKEIWPDGQDRELTFVYSTCGCPVKVMTRREGDRTKRTNELPVIFPDDPTVVSVITSLMRW
jgi:hypothetical protein